MPTTHFNRAVGQSSAPTTVFALRFNRKDKTTEPFALPNLEQELANPDVFLWIDIQGFDINALNETLRRLGIDLVLASHFAEPEILPRIVERPDCLAFYLYEIEDPEQHLDTSRGLRELLVERLILVVGDHFVLTYHFAELAVVNYVKTHCGESFRLWGRTQGFILFLFVQRCLYDYAHLNLANDNFLDQLEEEVIGGDPQELAKGVSAAAANILTLKKLAASLHIVLMLLGTKRSIFVSDEARISYQEMNQNAVAVRAAIDSSRDLLDGIVASVQAKAAHRTGDIARVLTVVSTIILPLSLIASIYGMNFEYMPELKSPSAYFIVLGGMGLLAAVLIGFFWKLGWIWRRKTDDRTITKDS
ncbi:MAG: CorA family divalent cation transporter [Verrucomicrobiota bacterium]